MADDIFAEDADHVDPAGLMSIDELTDDELQAQLDHVAPPSNSDEESLVRALRNKLEAREEGGDD